MSAHMYTATLEVTEAQGAILDGFDCGQQGCLFAHVQRRTGNRPTGSCRCIAQLKAEQVPVVETLMKQVLQILRGEAAT